MSSLWMPPIVRGRDDGHRQATWIELFFDLIFVVAVAQLSARLLANIEEGTLTAGVVVSYGLVYLPLWLSWVYATFYANRFDTDDLGQRLITFAEMVAVAAMAASVADVTAIQFAVAVAAFRLLVALSYARVRSAVPEARALAVWMMTVMVTSAAAWVLSAFVEGDLQRWMWAAIVVGELTAAFWPSFRKTTDAVPLQLTHLPERFGLFTMIVLGETVLAVVVGVAHAHWAASAAIFGAVALTISFSLWWIYFESVPVAPMRHHSSLRSRAWVLSHAPFVISVTALGVAMEVAVLTHFGEQLERPVALLLSFSLATVLASIAALRMTDLPSTSWSRLVLTRLPAIVVVAVLGFLPISAQALLGAAAIVAAIQAIADVRSAMVSPETASKA